MGIFDEEGERREGRKQEREERKTVNLRTWSVGRCSEGWKTGKEGFAIDYIEAKNYFVLYIMQNGTADESAKERELAEYGKDRRGLPFYWTLAFSALSLARWSGGLPRFLTLIKLPRQRFLIAIMELSHTPPLSTLPKGGLITFGAFLSAAK